MMSEFSGRDDESRHWSPFHHEPAVQLALDLLAVYQEWEKEHPEIAAGAKTSSLARGACFLIVHAQGSKRCNLAYLLRVLWWVTICWWKTRR